MPWDKFRRLVARYLAHRAGNIRRWRESPGAARVDQARRASDICRIHRFIHRDAGVSRRVWASVPTRPLSQHPMAVPRGRTARRRPESARSDRFRVGRRFDSAALAIRLFSGRVALAAAKVFQYPSLEQFNLRQAGFIRSVHHIVGGVRSQANVEGLDQPPSREICFYQ